MSRSSLFSSPKSNNRSSGGNAANNRKLSREVEIRRQMQAYRENLSCICRLAIRTLVEKASCEGVDDSCNEFKNLATILEHILSHRLKGQITWFGLEGSKEFWDFIVASCSSLPNNCIMSIRNMEDARTPKAKGRAWIRTALMEKRLAEYFSHAVTNSRAIKAFYGEGAFMSSDECLEIVQELERLNTVDFNCCLKGERLETGVAGVIDYAVYLKQLLRNYDMQEASRTHQPITIPTLSCPALEEDIEDIDQSAEDRLSRLQSQYKIVCAQKNYLEEIIRHKEKSISDALQEIQRYQQTMRLLEQQSRQDRQYWEKLVLDLQDQITSLKEAQMVSRRELEEHLGQYHPVPRMNSVGTYTGPQIALDNMVSRVAEVLPDSESLHSSGRDPSLAGTTSISSLTSSIRTTDEQRADDHHTSSSLQVTRIIDKEPTPSLVPLAGSFTSEVSLRSTETSWSGMTSTSDSHTHQQQQVIRPLLQDSGSASSESGISGTDEYGNN